MRLIGRHGTGWLGRAPAVALVALALAVSSGAGVALACESAPGTLKVHEYGTPSGTESNDPKVCAFNLEGFGFDHGQKVALAFSVQGGDGLHGTLPDPNWFGPYSADADGSFASAYFNHGGATLAAGHYKATAYGKDNSGAWTEMDRVKSKVFEVDCPVPKGTVTVTKTLAEGSQPAGDTTFPVTVTCKAADYTKTFDLAVGQSATTQALRAGTACAVTEVQPPGWDPPAFTPSGTVTVRGDADVAVTVVNNRPAPPVVHRGTVIVTKVLAEGSMPAGDQTFPVTVVCKSVGYRHTFHLAVGESATTGQLPAGTRCTVKENQPVGWDAPTFAPAATVTVKACGTTRVRVVNNQRTPPPAPMGTVTVTKALAEGSQPAGGTTFPVTVTCIRAEYAQRFDLAVGASGTTDALPAGSQCIVSETAPTGWDAPTFAPAATVTVPADGDVAVTVINNRPAPPVASLTLTKANEPTGSVQSGDEIVYTLTATASGTVDQDGVVISDAIPTGTTYVAGSGHCVPASTSPCDVGYSSSARLLTFAVGTLSPGGTVMVAFSVTVGVVPTTVTSITNVGAVKSALTEATSNPVTNKLVAVLGETIFKPQTGLAATGTAVPIAPLLALGLSLNLSGALLLAAVRRNATKA